MKTYKVRVPRHRLPFFTLADGRMYVDLLWNHGDPLELTVEDWASLLRSARAGALVIGRPLCRRERLLVLAQLGDGSAEAVGLRIPVDNTGRRPRGK